MLISDGEDGRKDGGGTTSSEETEEGIQGVEDELKKTSEENTHTHTYRRGALRGIVAVTCNSSLYLHVYMSATSGGKTCSCVLGDARKPTGLMNSFISNCQHLSAAGDSFVRLTAILL